MRLYQDERTIILSCKRNWYWNTLLYSHLLHRPPHSKLITNKINTIYIYTLIFRPTNLIQDSAAYSALILTFTISPKNFISVLTITLRSNKNYNNWIILLLLTRHRPLQPTTIPLCIHRRLCPAGMGTTLPHSPNCTNVFITAKQRRRFRTRP